MADQTREWVGGRSTTDHCAIPGMRCSTLSRVETLRISDTLRAAVLEVMGEVPAYQDERPGARNVLG